MPKILGKATVVNILRRKPITRVVPRQWVGRPLLRLLGVHGTIQVFIYSGYGQLTLLSAMADADLENALSRHRGMFYAASRKALVVALDEQHDDKDELRRRLEGIAMIDWRSAAGREFDQFIAPVDTNEPGRRRHAGHRHYLPDIIPAATSRRGGRS